VIPAPAAERARVMAIFSASDTPARGAATSAEPPPLTTATARSSGPSDPSRASISRVAATAAGVGRLNAAALVSRTSIPATSRPEPSGTLTRPVIRSAVMPPAATASRAAHRFSGFTAATAAFEASPCRALTKGCFRSGDSHCRHRLPSWVHSLTRQTRPHSIRT